VQKLDFYENYKKEKAYKLTQTRNYIDMHMIIENDTDNTCISLPNAGKWRVTNVDVF
jgi:hypothetical protein